MHLALVVCFLNEEAYLPTFLQSLEAQERPPDQLLLVDDGSSDGSPALARAFASEHDYARAITRPRRPAARDRLVAAAELEAFSWAVEQLDARWDVVAKVDADLEFTPGTIAELVRQLDADPRLGIAGALHSVIRPDGRRERERCPPGHVHGSTKFYRRACFDQVYPLPIRLGWDTSDEVAARMHGWRTESFSMPDGDPIHLRPIATQDGQLRGYRRTGKAAYAYGARPWWVLLGTLSRLPSPPRILGAANFFAGWLGAALRRDPRADARHRAFLAREHRARLLSGLTRRSAG